MHPHSGDPGAYLWPGREKGGDANHTTTSDGVDRRITFGEPLRCAGIYRRHVLESLKARGLRELSWYSFRHFFAS